MLILNSDITFVIQGQPYIRSNVNYTVKCIESIRTHYPDSKIIFSLSSPSLENKSTYNVDEFTFSDDPGGIDIKGKKLLNVNRQIVSSLAGIKKANTKWVCKVRADMYFSKYISFEKIYRKKNNSSTKKVFDEKVIVSDITTKNFELKDEYVDHVSDWLYFGLTTDLYKLFNIPLYDEAVIELASPLSAVSAERYIWTKHLFNKSFGFRTVSLAQEYLVNNAIIISAKKKGIKCYKKGYSFPFGVNGFSQYNEQDWHSLYKKIADEDHQVKMLPCLLSDVKKIFYNGKYHLFDKPVLFIYKAIFK